MLNVLRYEKLDLQVSDDGVFIGKANDPHLVQRMLGRVIKLCVIIGNPSHKALETAKTAVKLGEGKLIIIERDAFGPYVNRTKTQHPLEFLDALEQMRRGNFEIHHQESQEVSSVGDAALSYNKPIVKHGTWAAHSMSIYTMGLIKRIEELEQERANLEGSFHNKIRGHLEPVKQGRVMQDFRQVMGWVDET